LAVARDDEVAQLGQESGVDRVRKRVFAVEQVGAGRLEALARLPAELHRDDLVVGAVADRDRIALEPSERQVEALDLRHEARQRHDSRRPLRRAPAEAERPAHHRALREAADHGALPRHPTRFRECAEPPGQLLVALHERLAMREADALHDVPVVAARR
jgi:hypothetical protein